MRRSHRVRPPNPRQRRRRILFAAGALPALLVALFALHVALMLQHNTAGRDAYGAADYDAATGEFVDNQSRNWLQSWIAHFNEGASLHTDGAWPDAITAYTAALEDVPRAEECTVRINLALVHEAVGDAALAGRDTGDALDAWQAGINVLAAGNCPTDSGRGKEQTADAAAVDERLRNKIEQSQPQPQEPEPEPGEDPSEQPDGDKPDPRQEQLERNNEQGREQRREDQELYEDRDYSKPNSW